MEIYKKKCITWEPKRQNRTEKELTRESYQTQRFIERVKDTEEVSLPPIHDVEAKGDVVQEQLPADPAHLFYSSPLLGRRPLHILWSEREERDNTS